MSSPLTTSSETDVDAVVVGAGFSGLYMTYRLRELGLTVRGFESGSDVGGTWYWNRYPGARTDSQSFIYSFTFSKELRDEWVWTEKYPGQPEVLKYLQYVAERFDLRKYFTFDTQVTSAQYDDERQVWRVVTEQGHNVTARFLITAVGVLSATSLPKIDGINSFGGDWYHTGNWPQEPVDFAGKRVGVIGAGSSGVQILPLIAEDAAQVTLFQRTPNYVVPSQNARLSDADRTLIEDRYDELMTLVRQHPASHPYTAEAPSAKDADPKSREEIYEKGWQMGGFAFLMATFDDLLGDPDSNETAAEFIRKKIRETVKDETIAEVLSPRGYPYGAKRPPAGTNYYETFNRDNVKLVDVKANPIDALITNGVRLANGDEVDVDIVVFATGFDAGSGGLLRIDIRGTGGVSLRDQWADGPNTYLGFGTPGFPNMFMVIGPQVPFANMPTCIEENVNWIANHIAYMKANGKTVSSVTSGAADAWTREVEEASHATLMQRGDQVNSWMHGANIEGKPRASVFYLGGANVYFDRATEVAEQDFVGYEIV